MKVVFSKIFSGGGNEDPHALPDFAEKIFEVADGGYYYLNPETGEEYFSQNMRTLCKLGDHKVDFDQLYHFFDRQSYEKLSEALGKIKSTNSAELMELRLQSFDGKTQVKCTAGASVDMTGKVHHIVFWFRDASHAQATIKSLKQDSEKLKAELNHFSHIFHLAPFPVWQRDAELNIRYGNLAYGELAGEGEGAAQIELYHGAKNLAKQAKESSEIKSERKHIVASGQRRLYQVTEVPSAEDGGTVGYAHDISDIEGVEQELERYISAQSDLLESSASAMAIYGRDTRLKFYNNAFVALWKLDEALLGTQPTYAEMLELLREKRKLPEQANFRAFKQQQVKLFTDLIQPQEEFFYLPEGQTLRVLAIPHALGGILFVYEDVTDRLALERSYNTLIAVQNATLDNLHEGVIVFGEDGRVKLCNPVFMKLWQMEEADVTIGTHITQILEKTRGFYQYADWEDFKSRFIGGLHVRKVNYQRVERTDGSVLDFISVPLPDGATLMTYFDVTDTTVVERSLREKNEALQAADRLKSEFLANISYELRSPLTSISGFSEMLRQDYFGKLSDQQREYVDAIYQSSQHLMDLIDDILDLATIEAGYMRLNISQVNIRLLLQSAAALATERMRDFNIKVKVECPAKIGSFMADEVRLKQALFNLLSNAVKFSNQNSEVVLGVAEQGKEEIAIWVEDKGIGIPPEEQEIIFGKFYKSQPSKGARAGAVKSGTGLGLAMVKSFIELHGGRIELVSTPGEGTKVTCILPRENKAQQPLQPAAEKSA